MPLVWPICLFTGQYIQLEDQQVAPPTIFISGTKSPLTNAFVLLAPFLDQTNTKLLPSVILVIFHFLTWIWRAVNLTCWILKFWFNCLNIFCRYKSPKNLYKLRWQLLGITIWLYQRTIFLIKWSYKISTLMKSRTHSMLRI